MFYLAIFNGEDGCFSEKYDTFEELKKEINEMEGIEITNDIQLDDGFNKKSERFYSVVILKVDKIIVPQKTIKYELVKN